MSRQACRPIGVEPGGELIDPAADVLGAVPPFAARAEAMAVEGPMLTEGHLLEPHVR